jgi:hypothetical protein
MALDILPVYESRQAAQYDGTNSANLAAEIADFTVTNETATALTFTSGGTTYTVAVNGYVAWYQGVVTEVFQNEDDFRDVYAAVTAAMAHVHDLTLTTGLGRAEA